MGKISKKLILTILILIGTSFYKLQVGFAQNDDNEITYWIKIHRIILIDSIENPSQPEYVDWHYYITVNYGGLSICENKSYEKCFLDKYVNDIYEFEISSKIFRFYIDLVDEDVYTRRDLADISSHIGGGIDNYEDFTRGTRFSAIFDAVYNRLLDADNTTQSSEYYITSGEYDGSSGVDENDAEIWFSIWDNYDQPTARAGSDRLCFVGRTVLFDGTNSSASDASDILRYEWDFDNDGEFELLGSRISHIFTFKGQYNISLKVTDSFGEIDIDTCTIDVDNSPPLTSFTYFPTNSTTLDTIQFNDTSVDIDGYVKSRFWDFGDGYNSTEKTPSHRYAEKGAHNVTLIVEDNTGNLNSSQRIVNIQNIPPKADFIYSPKDPDKGEVINFKDMTHDPDCKTLRYEWDFGDDHTSSDSNPIHSYNSAGQFAVCLTVTDEEGESDAITKFINVIQRHDLTIKVRDLLGFYISNAEVKIVSKDTSVISETTNKKGVVTFSKIPQGLYEVKIQSLGITISKFYPLTSSITEHIIVPLSYHMLGLTFIGITILSIIGFYMLKIRK